MTQDASSLDVLKAALADELGRPQTDFTAILRLASDISKEEEGVVRFSTDAAMVRRLGRELVAKQETALGELVKNAYDADATVCTVDLTFRDDFEWAFDIVDNGNGMTRAELEQGFMRLASDAKVRSPYSPRFGRSRAGKKGIGRFATERLGRQLTIVTQTENEGHGWTVTIDWDAFAQGEDIGLVSNRIVQSEKEKPHGTRLSIEGLRDTWGEADLKRVYRYLSTLLQPMFEEAEAQPDPEDEGFSVTISKSGFFLEKEEVATSNTEILGKALAIIEGKIDEEGVATWSLVCPRFELSLTDVPIGLDRNKPASLAHARNVRVKAWYFIQKSEFLGHSTRFIGTVLDEHGGIRLYRNGYRVPPYGEKHDDWLGLDVKNTQIYAPLNSKAFMGFVAVNDAEGRVFEETSSREGLIHTPALEEVRQVTKSILTAAAGRIEAARGRGRKPTKAKESDAGKKAASEAEEAAAGLETLIADVEKDGGAGLDPQLQDRLIAIAEKVSQAARVSAEVARERDELVAELGMLRILASMGLTIAEFTHDFSALAETMELNLDEIAVELPGGAEAFGVSFEHFRSQFRQVRAYTAHFSAMTTRNASRELQSIDLYNFVREFQKELAVMFERRGMQFEIERPEVYDLRTVPMHRSEWSSILLNLLTNAIKASDRAGRTGQFLLRFGELPGNKVYLDFCDNGDGIPAENRKVVFDAFFTTSGGAGARASETRQALGTGLGLKIVADIASAAGGEVTVCDEVPAGYHTCIRVTVPGARDRTES